MAYLCRRQDGKECDCCMECMVGSNLTECPECGRKTFEYLYYKDGVTIGCDGCIERRAWDE